MNAVTATAVTGFVDVLALAELPPGSQRHAVVGTTRLLLCHEAPGGPVWAMHEHCPHAFQPLVGGVVQQGLIQCPKHGACFDLATGAPTNPVTTRRLSVHATRVEGGRVFVSPNPSTFTTRA